MIKIGFIKALFSLSLLLPIALVSVIPANAHEVAEGWECNIALMTQSQRCNPENPRADRKPLFDHMKAEVNQAESLYLLGKHDEAFEALLPLALKGHPSAQFYLAELYQTDNGNLDKNQAMYWYLQAANQGNPNAQFNLANAYYDGKVVPADLPKAAGWYERAAISGVPEAQLNLGYMYSQGKGVPKNDEVATLWYTVAAKRGNTKAQSNLGYRYCTGVGVEVSLGQCAFWVKKAMDQGHGNAKKIWDSFKLEHHFNDADKMTG